MAAFAPTVAEIKLQVTQKLRLDSADATKVLYWMNQAYMDAAQYSSFKQASTTVTIVAESATVTLPATVKMVRQVQRIFGSNPASAPARLIRYEEMLTKLQADSTPTGNDDTGGYYAISGESPNELLVWPVPSIGDGVKVLYSAVPDALVNDNETLAISEPFGSKIVEYGALVEGAKFKKDPLLYDYENTLALWMDRYIGWLNRRKTANSNAFEIWDGMQSVDRLEAEREH